MIEEKKLKQAENRIKKHIKDEIIKTKSQAKFTEFFLENAQNSLDSAKALYELSIDEAKQEKLGFMSFNGLLWVVNASYYSMFYMVRALLENKGVKIKTEQSIHSITFDALIYYSYLNGKLEKQLIDSFIEAKEDASELLGKQKADELVEGYYFEKRKRAAFTYNMGSVLLETKAKTSLGRAKLFCKEIRKILKK